MTKGPDKRPNTPAGAGEYGSAEAAMQASQAATRQAVTAAEAQTQAAMAAVRQAGTPGTIGPDAVDAAMQASEAAQRGAEAAVRATEDIIARAGKAAPPALSPATAPTPQAPGPAEPD